MSPLRAFVAYRVEEGEILIRLADGMLLKRALPEDTDPETCARHSALAYLLGCSAFGDKVFETEPFVLQDWESHWSQTELEPEQRDLLVATAVAYGHLESLSVLQMAEALGVTRQAIHSRLKHGSLPSIKTPRGLQIPLPLIQGPDRETALAFFHKATSHA